MMKLPKILTLDCSKWRCGSDGEYALGDGVNMLENVDGYQCCLGQFAAQAGVDKSKLQNTVMPCYLGIKIEGLNKKRKNKSRFYNTKLSEMCADINDNEETTIKQKIAAIRKELEKTGRKLVVKNLKKVLKVD